MRDSDLHIPADGISSLLPASDRKPMKYALYNSLAIILLILVLILCSAIFLTFQVFLRPIGWALVVGTCLFPCKMMLTTYFREYLQHGKENERSFSLAVALMPVHLIQSSASVLMKALKSALFPLILTILSTGTFLFMQEFGLFASLGLFFFQIYFKLVDFFVCISKACTLRTSTVLIAIYLFVILSKSIQMSRTQSNILQISLRFLFFNAFASYLGVFQPVFVFGLVAMTIWGRHLPNSEPTGEERLPSSTAGTIFRRLSLLPQSSNQDSSIENEPQHPSDSFGNSNNNAVLPSDSSSALVRACFTGLALLHFSVAFWTRTWLFRLVLFAFTFVSLAFITSNSQLIPTIIWVLKQALEYVKTSARLSFTRPTADSSPAPTDSGGSDVISTERNVDIPLIRNSEASILPSMNGEEESLSDLILPNSLKLALKRLCKIERRLYDFVDDYLDYLVSLIIISLMVLITLLFTVFLMVQVYSETLNLIALSSSVINSTIQSGTFSWLPDKDQLGATTRSAISNVHQFGRTVIKSKVDELFRGNLANRSDIEEQLLELWERVCMQFFHESNGTEALMSKNAVKSNFVLTGDFATGLNNATHNVSLGHLRKRIRHLFFSLGSFDYRDLIAYFHENVGEIMKVVDPVWRILSSHASFILSLFMGTASLLLSGGSVVLNFSFSIIIFLSTLFYLLAASERTYLPVDFVVSLTPQRGEASPVVICFYASVEAAVASVMVTTLKRTVFYGMYTLLTHTLLGLDIVVLPSIIATVLGAVPLMGPYWPALPGVVELWCIRGSYWQAILLLLLHLLPYYILDTALYTEIKGAGHPYLTGLSIAGGLYYFGFEGVFIGPMILCCLLVGVNLYRFLLTRSTEPLHTTSIITAQPTVSISPLN